MLWLMVLAVIVMIVGFIATMMIGESKENKKENSNYFKFTGKKWMHLSWIYVLCTVMLAIIMIVVWKN
ncbi:hypothetical protein [Paenibacillus dokdonensis]|uniref:hypothetical protein n=1 Tax=Paenibacillus dokdonensis TaxID=2567944 RepID=UPI0010A7B860|nr:hypothetical protein [Paenibacillus dokdonensis]